MKQTTDFYSKLPNAEVTERIFKSCKAQDEAAAKAAIQRMENYYNCIDDYSFGGIQDRVSDESRRSRMILCEKLQAQAENGYKAFIETFNVAVLCDLQGNVLTQRIVNGRYGLCWIIGNQNATFVAVAKKQATYQKKGYQLKTKKITVEYYYTGGISKSGRCMIQARTLSSELTNEVPELDTVGRDYYPVYIASLND